VPISVGPAYLLRWTHRIRVGTRKCTALASCVAANRVKRKMKSVNECTCVAGTCVAGFFHSHVGVATACRGDDCTNYLAGLRAVEDEN